MTYMSPEQCRAARAFLTITQDNLAIRAGVSKKHVNGFESLRMKVELDSIAKMQRYLTEQGIRFLFDPHGRPEGIIINDAEPAMIPEQYQFMWALHFRLARAWLGWSYIKLAEASGVSQSTVRDFEKDRRLPHRPNLVAVELAIKLQGIRFVFDQFNEPIGISVQLVDGVALAA